jgi:hypothetical protein
LKEAGVLPSPGAKVKRSRFTFVQALRFTLALRLKKSGVPNARLAKFVQFLDDDLMSHLLLIVNNGQGAYITVDEDPDYPDMVEMELWPEEHFMRDLAFYSKPLLFMCVNEMVYEVLKLFGHDDLADEFEARRTATCQLVYAAGHGRVWDRVRETGDRLPVPHVTSKPNQRIGKAEQSQPATDTKPSARRPRAKRTGGQ